MEEVVRDAWVPARGDLMAGKAFPGAGGGAVGGRRRKTEQGGWRWKTRVVLQFPKIPRTPL